MNSVIQKAQLSLMDEAETSSKQPRLAVVGSFDGSHVGGSLLRAAMKRDIEVVPLDVTEATSGNRLLRTLSWRLGGHRPLNLSWFSANVAAACRREMPDVLIATGSAALKRRAVRSLRDQGIICINYATDDPWNPTLCARWHLRALPAYNVVFTPRRANMTDLHDLGCADVRYLPFGFDESLTGASCVKTSLRHDVLFVGGADPVRYAFMKVFMREGPRVALVGGYWDRYAITRPHALGIKSPAAIRALTVSAKVNLCLVRTANRDGHVMRSFEIPASRGCMLVEDTQEHRDMFGADGEAVYFFQTPAEAAVKARALIADPVERARLAERVFARVTDGANTYGDRLATMLNAVNA